MSKPPLDNTVNRAIRIALALGGAIALIIGILILVWPGRTAEAVTVIIAVYALLAGLVYAGLGIFSKWMRGWARAGHIVLGLLFVAGAIIAFANLTIATEALALYIGILVGVLWIFEGGAALSTLDRGPRAWTIFYAILSILAGVVLLFAPIWGAAVLWLMIGISLVVLGALQLIRAFTFRAL